MDPEKTMMGSRHGNRLARLGQSSWVVCLFEPFHEGGQLVRCGREMPPDGNSTLPELTRHYGNAFTGIWIFNHQQTRR